MNSLTAVVITFNEEKNIGRCIRSLSGIVDEIIVVDSLSTDNTCTVARQLGATVFDVAWKGYAAQKNYGNELASQDWILSIDADEELSLQLQQSILEWKRQLPSFARFNRLTSYCGKWIRYSGWYPDAKIRIFHRKMAQWQGDIHEKLVLDTPLDVTFLKGDLLHYSITSISDQIKVIDKYSELAAQEMFVKGRKASYFRILFSPAFKFVRDYFFKRGFLDGYYGFLIAYNSAYSVFLKYARLKFKYVQQKNARHD
jgi:glycosyltransferase involved in cell wall biosynthesis